MLFFFCLIYIRGSPVILFATVYFKNLKNLEKHDKKSQSPQIFYVTEKKQRRKPAKKKISIPLEATVVKAEDLKKYFETKD